MPNLGKKFEERFKKDWEDSFSPSESLCFRIPDQVSRRKGSSQNICDFMNFDGNRLYLLEVKSHLGNTFPFSALRQYDKLKEQYERHYKNTIIGVILWFRDHDKVLYIPIEEIIKMIEDDKKSINIKMLNDDTYKLYEIPSTKLRTFMKSDYSCMKNIS